jgi:hypothetical protein
MFQNFPRYFKEVYKNELSIFIYLNAIFFYIPFVFNASFTPPEINYSLLFLFLLLNIIFGRPDFKMLLTSNISISLMFYIIMGLVFSMFFGSILEALKKAFVLISTMVLFFVYIYHKLDEKYVVNVLTSMTVVGLLVLWSVFFNLDNEGYSTYNHADAIRRDVFSLKSGVNIFIIMPLFVASIFTYYKTINQSKIMFLLLISAFFAYGVIILDNPVRVSLLFIILYLFLIQSKYVLLMIVLMLLIIIFNFESVEFVTHLLDKTQNESRLEFFKDIAIWNDVNGYIGFGLSVVEKWAHNHPYTILDINSIVLFYLETGIIGVVAIFTIIFSLIMKYKKNLASSSCQEVCADNYSNMRDFSIYILPLGITLILLPNIAILGQTSVFEYYFLFFILTLAYKTSRNIQNKNIK